MKSLYGEQPMKEVGMNAVYGADRLGRVIPSGEGEGRRERLVGIFYFLWLEQNGTDGPWDVSRVLAEDPTAATDMNHPAWGSLNGTMHHWGEPLFGYYFTRDEWVIRRHIELLAFADVDFLVFDTTNRVIYFENATKIMGIIAEYAKAGYRVPKVAFYTNTDSGATVNELYDRIYSKNLYPESWFLLDGKPLVIDKPDECRAEVRDFFTHRVSQWPFDPVHPGGFPWMEFIRPQRVYRDADGQPEIMNVSVAQHPNCAHSDSAFYGEYGAWGRSWHDGGKDIRENAWEYGFNFAEQWEYALKIDPKMVFVTGWNEWIAGRWTFDRTSPSTTVLTNEEGTSTYTRAAIPEKRGVMCDCCSLEYSRDIEPMKGGYSDNYYMQLVEYVRRYKGAEPDPSDDGEGLFYRDFPFGNLPRDCRGYGTAVYREKGSANDILTMTVRRQGEDFVFSAAAREAIKPEGNWMRLYIVPTGQKQYGSVLAPWRTETYILTPDGAVTKYLNKQKTIVGRAEVAVRGAMIFYTVSREALGLGPGAVSFDFKWADGVEDDGTAEDFYLHGNCAPAGRLCYRYTSAE